MTVGQRLFAILSLIISLPLACKSVGNPQSVRGGIRAWILKRQPLWLLENVARNIDNAGRQGSVPIHIVIRAPNQVVTLVSGICAMRQGGRLNCAHDEMLEVSA